MISLKQTVIGTALLISLVAAQADADRAITIKNTTKETIYLAVNPQQSRCAFTTMQKEHAIAANQQYVMTITDDNDCPYRNRGSLMVGIRSTPGTAPTVGADAWFEVFSYGDPIFDQQTPANSFTITGNTLIFSSGR